MDLTPILDELKEHAASTYPNECCGLAIIFKGRLKYIKCNNLLDGDLFCIDPVDYAKAEDMGEVVGVCHSHNDTTSKPSEADIISCNTSELPWLIINYPYTEYTQLEPIDYKVPLIGRPFLHGVLDCYSLIRDYYKDILNIKLSDYARQPNWWELDSYNLYEDNFKSEGFEVVNDLKKHDIILMQHGSSKVNHGAIYVEDNIILHHSTNKLSSRDVYGGYWRKNTRYVIRHKTLL